MSGRAPLPPVDPPTVAWRDADGEEQLAAIGDVADVPFERALPVRDIPSRPGQTHTPGLYWAATTGGHVPFESYLESQWLTVFDFDPHAVAFSAQPFRLQSAPGGEHIDHVVDFFVRYADGSASVVDVSAPRRRHKPRLVRQADITRRCVEQLGWSYRRLYAPPWQRWLNIEWLAGFRRPLHYGMEHRPQLLAQAAAPIALHRLIEQVGDPLRVRPVIFHLAWHHELLIDLDAPMSAHTLLHANPSAATTEVSA